MTEKYKDFIIKKNKMACAYGEKRFIITNYLVYKEIDGIKYFLPNITAFDTVEKAKEVIDKLST